MNKKTDQNTNFIKSLGKETTKKVADESHAQLTRIGGWASGGSKKTIVNAINKGIQKLSK